MSFQQNSTQPDTGPILTSLNQSRSVIESTLGNSTDLITRELKIGTPIEISAEIFYIDGLAKSETINPTPSCREIRSFCSMVWHKDL